MDPRELEIFKTRLVEEKERLERELASFAVPDRRMRDDWDTIIPTPSPPAAPLSHASQEEQADIREEIDTTVAQEHALELRLREVNQALARIANRTFGLCQRCGQPIAPERLEANPAAVYDMEHQPRE